MEGRGQERESVRHRAVDCEARAWRGREPRDRDPSLPGLRRRNPSAWRRGNLKISRSVSSVSIARLENCIWAPRLPDGAGFQDAMARSEIHRVMSPRCTSARVSIIGAWCLRAASRVGRSKKQRSGAASEYGDRQAERRQREEAGRGMILTPPAPRLDPARVVQRQSARLRPQLSLRGRACRQLEPVSWATR
jgi:hypothetical protein